MRRAGAPLLMNTLAERKAAAGEQHQLATLRYTDPTHPHDRPPIELTGIALGISYLMEFSPLGTNRVETKAWQIPAGQLAAAGIGRPHRDARLWDEDGEWQLHVDGCKFGQGLEVVTLGLRRAPKTAGNELRLESQ